MRDMIYRQCTKCCEMKKQSLFPILKRVDGKVYYRRTCKICYAKINKEQARKRKKVKEIVKKDKGGYFDNMPNCSKAMRSKWVGKKEGGWRCKNCGPVFDSEVSVDENHAVCGGQCIYEG